jgi:hypothetical protein
MTIVIFPRPSASRFLSVASALAWYAARDLRPTTIPPIDAVFEPTGDTYLATIFAGLLAMPTATARIAHLHAKADEQDRHRAALDLEGHPGSDAHAAVRDALRKWARELSEAATEATFTGGAA